MKFERRINLVEEMLITFTCYYVQLPQRRAPNVKLDDYCCRKKQFYAYEEILRDYLFANNVQYG